MKNKDELKKPRNVVKKTRDAVVGAAERVQVLRQKTGEFAQKAQRKWDESKPRQRQVKSQLENAAQQVVGFGQDVRKGLEEGFAEVKKRKDGN